MIHANHGQDLPFMPSTRRHALVASGLLVIVCILGIGSRRFSSRLPAFVAAYAGDTLWALALFLFLGLVLRRASTGRIAALAVVLSLLVEVSQLYHASWIDAIRETRVGGLVLGFGFLWSDLVCYAAGVALGVAIDRLTAAAGRARSSASITSRGRGRTG